MSNKAKKILTEISAGELLDKISILEIKLEKVADKNNLEEIKKEHTVLKEAQSSNISFNNKINDLYKSLKEINLKLWNIEDKLRIYEKEKNFSKNFIDLARDVYITNDKRSMVKSEINKELGSNIKEIKQYVKY